MNIQPGSGYGFNSSGYGVTLDVSNPFPSTDAVAPRHPFKIVNVEIVTSGGSNKVRYQVVPGTLNNIVAAIDDVTAGTLVQLNRTNATTGQPDPPTAELDSTSYDSTSKISYIVLRAGPETASPYNYPDPVFTTTSNRYPQIIGGNEVPADADTWGFVCIGTISVDSITSPTTFSVTQYVTGSLWGDRIKLGTDTAQYYYARI
jgi:hypothetical protein